MEFCELDPQDLSIDKTNERRSNPGSKTKGGDLEKSIAENGVVFPIYVREVEGELRVVAGQRRTLAAQAVGEETIPAIKMDLDEPDARAISIMENDEQLRKDVPRKDRARATKAYVKTVGSKSIAAENLGVTKQTIENRLETTRSFWKETEFGVDTRSEKDTENLPDQLLTRIRSVSNSGKEAEKMAIQIIEDKIPRKIVDAALSKSDSRSQFEKHLDQLYYRDDEEDNLKLVIEVELEGQPAHRLSAYSKDKGTTPEEAATKLVKKRLNEMDHYVVSDNNAEISDFE